MCSFHIVVRVPRQCKVKYGDMLKPVKSGAELMEEIRHTITATPSLWWLGHAGFAIRFASITFYIDLCLSEIPGRTRLVSAPLHPEQIVNADLLLASHAHPGHLDTAAAAKILEVSKSARLVIPKSATEFAHSAGVPYARMTTTDSGLRIEYFKDNLYGRVYAIPSAHPELDWTPAGGYPYLGYLVRFGRWTIYHAGDCRPYPELASRLKPFNVSVAILPIGGTNFTASEAAQLTAEIGASWLVPMHYGTFGADLETEFVTHMLGHHPELRFRVFQCGEKWTVPEE
jgi:L-ascorbate metabolism protein UlaG (beta-lactamase superfamily)